MILKYLSMILSTSIIGTISPVQWSVEIDCEMTFHALVEYTGVFPNPVFRRMKKKRFYKHPPQRILHAYASWCMMEGCIGSVYVDAINILTHATWAVK
jgi:hypothetical protein